MTPRIDVAFQLLIFFLCTLHVRQREGKLDAFLPRDAGAAPNSTALDPLELRLVELAPGMPRDPHDPSRPWNASGSWELSGRRLECVLGPRRFEALDGLGRRREELVRSAPERAPTLGAGPGTLQGDEVSVLDRILDAGLRDVRISGRIRGPSSSLPEPRRSPRRGPPRVAGELGTWYRSRSPKGHPRSRIEGPDPLILPASLPCNSRVCPPIP